MVRQWSLARKNILCPRNENTEFDGVALLHVYTDYTWVLGFVADFYFGHYRGLKLKTSCGKF